MSRPAARREEGLALLMTALVLMLVVLLAFASLHNSQRESTSGARARATTRTLHAADAGIQVARRRLTQSPPDLSAIDITLASGAQLQSRRRADSTPKTLEQVGLGAPPEGFSVNVGAGAKYVSRVFQVNVTSLGGGSTSEVEARLSRIGPEATGY